MECQPGPGRGAVMDSQKFGRPGEEEPLREAGGSCHARAGRVCGRKQTEGKGHEGRLLQTQVKNSGECCGL